MSLKRVDPLFGPSKKRVRFVDEVIDKRSALGRYCPVNRLLSALALFVAIVALILGHFVPDSCDDKLDTQVLFANIRKYQILHQDEALVQLQVALRNRARLNAIALTGPHGVGKTFVAKKLMEHFPWPYNVQSLSWQTAARCDAEKLRIIHLMVKSFSNCGINLLIIDNLATYDHAVVPQVNTIISGWLGLARNRVIVIYIFSLNMMEHEIVYDKQWEILQSLPVTATINFNGLGTYELMDCVRREAKLHNLSLTPKAFEKIIHSIDVKRTGCKYAHARVWEHGKPLP